MNFTSILPAKSILILTALLTGAAPLGATTIYHGAVYDDPGYLFDTFGNNADETSRGANFGSATSVTWYGINMTHDSTGATNGIAWTGTPADSSTSVGAYNYSNIYFGTPGTGAAANSLTNFGIHSYPTITISVTPGATYSIDLLFANAISARTFDVNVEGSLYLDNLALDITAEKRPLVYRFQIVAPDNQIQIALTDGAEPGYTDTNPYVQAMMVTKVVPEPSALIMTATGLLGLAFRRNRR